MPVCALGKMTVWNSEASGWPAAAKRLWI